MVEILQPSSVNLEMSNHVAAVDLGATSGRVCLGWVESGALKLEEIYRFNHEVIEESGKLYWQWDYIVEQVIKGLRQANERRKIAAIGVDFWAVDYGLVDENYNLISTPRAYRDTRTEKYFENIPKELTPEFIYKKTGIQFLFFNTLYQLVAESTDSNLKAASKFLMLPDLLNNILCGSTSNEITNASTTQLLNAFSRDWDWELIERVNLPKDIFPKLHKPGQILGSVRGFKELDGIPVIAVGSHDTASAVAGTPLDASGTSAYISSGTWSLVGLELRKAITDEKTFQSNITNELGVENRVRFIKNVAGLWMLEESIRYWRKNGIEVKVAELVEEALKLERGRAFVDARDPKFTKSGAMPIWIQEECKKNGGFLPQTPAEIALVIFESLAVAYRAVIIELQEASGVNVSQINIVGGGSANRLLNQLTSDKTRLPVFSGPMEATAFGNIIVQLISLGDIKDLDEGRKLIAKSISQHEFRPQ